MALVLGSLPPLWEAQLEFWAHVFGLAWPQMLQASGE